MVVGGGGWWIVVGGGSWWVMRGGWWWWVVGGCRKKNRVPINLVSGAKDKREHAIIYIYIYIYMYIYKVLYDLSFCQYVVLKSRTETKIIQL